MKKAYRTSRQQLDARIISLEAQKEKDFINLKSQFYKTSEHYKPVNFLNRTIRDFKESSEAKNSVFETLLSITGGYFSKQLIIGKSNSFFKKILGYVLQYSVTRLISKKVSASTNN